MYCRGRVAFLLGKNGFGDYKLSKYMRGEKVTADFYLRLFLAALIILGVWNALGEKQILSKVGDFLEKRWYGKPLGLCPACAASIYGTATWFLTGGTLPWWPAFVLALSGLMVIIDRKILHG